MSQQTYYGIQSGASFMNGMMDAYNRAVGMQANIVQYENQMRRQNLQDVRQIRMDDLSIKNMEEDRKYKNASLRLDVSSKESEILSQIGELDQAESLDRASGRPTGMYEKRRALLTGQLGSLSKFSEDLGFGTTRTAAPVTTFTPKPVTGETVPYKSQIYGESPLYPSISFTTPTTGVIPRSPKSDRFNEAAIVATGGAAELDNFYKNNPNITGNMESGTPSTNPYSKLTDTERQSVLRNESVRLYMNKNNLVPDFQLTPEQKNMFKGTAYEKDENALKQSIVARIISGDPSAGNITPEQKQYAQKIGQAWQTTQTPAKPLTEADIANMTFKNSQGKVGGKGQYLFPETVEDGDKEVDAIYNAVNTLNPWWRTDGKGNPTTPFTPKPIPLTLEQMKLGTDAVSGPAKAFVEELDKAATSDNSYLTNESRMNILISKHLSSAQAAVGDSTNKGLTEGVQKKISRYAYEQFVKSVKNAKNLLDPEKDAVMKRVDTIAKDLSTHTVPLTLNGKTVLVQINKDSADVDFFNRQIDVVTTGKFPVGLISDKPSAGFWEGIASQLLKPGKAVASGLNYAAASGVDAVLGGTDVRDLAELNSRQLDNVIAPHTKPSVLNEVVAQAGPFVDILYAGTLPGKPESKGQNKSILQQIARGITVQNDDGTTREIDIENPKDREVLKVIVSKNLELATYKLANFNIGVTTLERLSSLWNAVSPYRSRVAEPEHQQIRRMGYGYGGF